MNTKKTAKELIISAITYLRTEWREVIKGIFVMLSMGIFVAWACCKGLDRDDLASATFFVASFAAFVGIVLTLLYCRVYTRTARKAEEDAKSEAKQLRKQRDNANSKNKGLEEDIQQLGRTVADLQSRLSEAQEAAAAANERANQCESVNHELRVRLIRAQNNLSDQVAENSALKKQMVASTDGEDHTDTHSALEGESEATDASAGAKKADITDIDEIFKIFNK